MTDHRVKSWVHSESRKSTLALWPRRLSVRPFSYICWFLSVNGRLRTKMLLTKKELVEATIVLFFFLLLWFTSPFLAALGYASLASTTPVTLKIIRDCSEYNSSWERLSPKEPRVDIQQSVPFKNAAWWWAVNESHDWMRYKAVKHRKWIQA